ncbi:MAG TPA: serine protease [Pilimelia sp.]|nr:serine protease [Pilimelia sp.]
MRLTRALAAAAAAVALAGAAASGGATATAGTAPRPAPSATPTPPGVGDFAGVIRISGCSAALVAFRHAAPDQPALMLTNGHCWTRMPEAGEVLVDLPADAPAVLLKADGSVAARLRTTRLLYATMTDTDAALHRLDTTYREIARRYRIRPFTLAARGPRPGDRITVNSAYHRKRYHCTADRAVFAVREAGWTWKNPIRYSPACDLPHGSSGAPLLDDATGEVVGVHNTSNDADDQPCALNNPCEVDEDGTVTSGPKDIGYAQQVAGFTTCVDARARLDLAVSGCTLPKPRARARR